LRNYFLLAIPLLAASVPSLLRADALSVGSATVGEGNFSLDVTITGASDVYAYQFDLTYDPTILQLTSIDEGPFLQSIGPTAFAPGGIDNTLGTATGTVDLFTGSGPGAAGDGTLATFNFQAISYGTSAVNLANVVLLDSGFNPIEHSTSGGTVTVQGTSEVPEPQYTLLMGLGLAIPVLKSRLAAWRRG